MSSFVDVLKYIDEKTESNLSSGTSISVRWMDQSATEVDFIQPTFNTYCRNKAFSVAEFNGVKVPVASCLYVGNLSTGQEKKLFSIATNDGSEILFYMQGIMTVYMYTNYVNGVTVMYKNVLKDGTEFPLLSIPSDQYNNYGSGVKETIGVGKGVNVYLRSSQTTTRVYIGAVLVLIPLSKNVLS